MSNAHYPPQRVRTSPGPPVQNRISGGVINTSSNGSRPAGNLRPVDEDGQWNSGASYTRSHESLATHEPKSNSQLSLVGVAEYKAHAGHRSPRAGGERSLNREQSANDKGMTYEDVQELIKAERVWWSEASERQVKNLESEIDSQVNSCFEKIGGLMKQLEDKLLMKLTEDRHEQQMQVTRLRNDVSAQQALVSDLERSHDSTKNVGMVSESSISRMREEMNSKLTALRDEFDLQREDQSKRLNTQAHQLNLQVQGVEQALSEVRRESAELRGQDIKLRTLEGTVASLSANYVEVHERTQAHAAAIRGAAGVDASINDLQKEISHAKGDHNSKYSSLEGAVREMQNQMREANMQQNGAMDEVRSKMVAAHSEFQSQMREETKGGISELSRQLSEVNERVSNTEKILRQEHEALRLEQQNAARNDQSARLSNEVQECRMEISRMVESERGERRNEMKEMRSHVDTIRANLEVTLDKTSRAMTAQSLPVESLEEKSRELLLIIREEEQARAKETVDLRSACKALSSTLDQRCQELTKAVQQEHETLEQRMAQVRSNCDALFAEVEATSKATSTAAKERADTEGGMRKDLSRLAFEVNRERQERETQVDMLKQQFQEQRADISEVRAHCARELAATSEELRNIERMCEQGGGRQGAVTGHQDAGAPIPTSMDATLVEAALGKERANQAARGELPSQVRADVMQKVETLENDFKQDVSSRITGLDSSLRGELTMRVETLETDLRCEIAARIHAVEAELRIAAPGASHMVARVQSVEEDLKIVQTQVFKHEGLTARVEALESGLQNAYHNPDQPVTGSLLADARAERSRKASFIPTPGTQHRAISATPGEPERSARADPLNASTSTVSGGNYMMPSQGGESSSGSLSLLAMQVERNRRSSACNSVPRSRSHSVQRSRDSQLGQAPPAPVPPQSATGEAEREFNQAFPTFSSMQATSSNKTPSVQPTPPTMMTPNPAGAIGTTMNQDLKESLVSLVSKVHSALVGTSIAEDQPTIAEIPGEAEADAAHGAMGADGAEAQGESSESRHVFKQALQELIEENRALQQETSQIMDGYEAEPSPAVAPLLLDDPAAPLNGPVGMQHMPPGRISMASVPGGEGGPLQVPGSLNIPPGSTLGQPGSMQMRGGGVYGGSLALPPYAGGGNPGGPAQIGGSMRVPLGGGSIQAPAPVVQPLQPSQPQQQGMNASQPGLNAGQGSMPNNCLSRTTPGALGQRQHSQPLGEKARSPSSLRAPGGPGPCRMNPPSAAGNPPQSLPCYLGSSNSSIGNTNQPRGRRLG